MINNSPGVGVSEPLADRSGVSGPQFLRTGPDFVNGTKWFRHKANPKLKRRLVSNAPTPMTRTPSHRPDCVELSSFRLNIAQKKWVLSSASRSKEVAVTVHRCLLILGI